ncbi:MAG: ACP phosphodiesterase [Ruminococcaceae bacterium]|nr:ACP phosphodiesterase [Oscillospiraceae bacterium]
MDKILFINACVRPESRTYELAKFALKYLKGSVEELRLIDEELPPYTNEMLLMRDKLISEGEINHPLLRYARQFAEADTIVIAAPYWDLIFPATLRLYFEHITVTGLTFRYTAQGFPESLCKAKRMIYITTAGGPVFANFGYDYCKTMAEAYFGIEDCCCFMAENLDIDGADVTAILNDVKREIDNKIK